MNALAGFLSELTVQQKALTALIGAVSFGVMLGAIGAQQAIVSTHELIETNTTRIEKNTETLLTIQALVQTLAETQVQHQALTGHSGVHHLECLIRLQLEEGTVTPLQVSQRCPR